MLALVMTALSIFLVLQAADFGTTLWFLQRGVSEANPLVAALMHIVGRPAIALLLFKTAACALAAIAWRTRRKRLLRRANAFFGLCVCWNLAAIAMIR
jgi:hypothetical protein